MINLYIQEKTGPVRVYPGRCSLCGSRGNEPTHAELAKQRTVRAWLHTDVLDRYWSIANLIHDFGVEESVIVTIHEPNDEQMAWAYSACDVVIANGLGEGFGFVAAESLACAAIR